MPRNRVQENWLSLLQDGCERSVQSLLPDLREQAIQKFLPGIQDLSIGYEYGDHPKSPSRAKRKIARMERMAIAGCKLALISNSTKMDLDLVSLREILVLLPGLSSTILQDVFRTIRSDLQDRISDRVDEAYEIIEEMLSTSDGTKTRSRVAPPSPLRRFRERGYKRHVMIPVEKMALSPI